MKVIAPLYKELLSQYKLTILALTSAGSYMRAQGIPSIGFNDFKFSHSPEVQLYGQNLAVDINESTEVSREETVAYLGMSFFDLVTDLGSEDIAYERYRDKGRAAFLPVATLKKIITELNVDAVITTNAPRAERAALIAAKELGIFTVCVNDNVWISQVADIVSKKLADRVCVLSNNVRERLITKTAADNECIVVTGTPVFDKLKKIQRTKNACKRPRVLLADQFLPDIHPFLDIYAEYPGIDEDVREELNYLASKGEVDVYFRPHPNQDYSYDKFKYCHVSLPTEDLHKRLSMTDVVVTAVSTVGVEGVVMGAGLVSIENTVFSKGNSYERIGMSTGVKKASELKCAIFSEYNKIKERKELYQGLASRNIKVVLDDLFDRTDV